MSFQDYWIKLFLVVLSGCRVLSLKTDGSLNHFRQQHFDIDSVPVHSVDITSYSRNQIFLQKFKTLGKLIEQNVFTKLIPSQNDIAYEDKIRNKRAADDRTGVLRAKNIDAGEIRSMNIRSRNVKADRILGHQIIADTVYVSSKVRDNPISDLPVRAETKHESENVLRSSPKQPSGVNTLNEKTKNNHLENASTIPIATDLKKDNQRALKNHPNEHLPTRPPNINLTEKPERRRRRRKNNRIEQQKNYPDGSTGVKSIENDLSPFVDNPQALRNHQNKQLPTKTPNNYPTDKPERRRQREKNHRREPNENYLEGSTGVKSNERGLSSFIQDNKELISASAFVQPRKVSKTKTDNNRYIFPDITNANNNQFLKKRLEKPVAYEIILDAIPQMSAFSETPVRREQIEDGIRRDRIDFSARNENSGLLKAKYIKSGGLDALDVDARRIRADAIQSNRIDAKLIRMKRIKERQFEKPKLSEFQHVGSVFSEKGQPSLKNVWGLQFVSKRRKPIAITNPAKEPVQHKDISAKNDYDPFVSEHLLFREIPNSF